MKRISTIGFLFIALIFHNCKNNKAPQNTIDSKDTEKIIEQEVENTKTLDTLQIEEIIKSEEKIKSTEIPIPEKIKKEVVKTDNNVLTKKEDVVIIKKENVTENEKVAEKEILDTKEIDEVTETEKEVEIKTEVNPKPTIEKPIIVSSSNNWVVPVKYKTLKNPTDPKVDLTIGKTLYSKHCKSCHGSKGYGDGSKADEMKGDLGDFSSKEFQDQSDGALFYKSTFGRDDMPRFSKKLPSDEDRWLVVNYMRTLAE